MDFLRTQVSVLNAAVLPYSNQIVILAEVFRRLPRPSKKHFEALTRWFWRTSASEYFGGWNTGNMIHDHEAIKKFAEGKLDDLPVAASKPTVETWSLATFRANNALSKCFALVIAAQRPRDLMTGQPISLDTALAWQNSKEFHHIFPRSIVNARDGEQATPGLLPNFTMLTSASNKAISNRRPSEYIRECRKALGADFNSVMASNLIDERAVKALLRDNFEAFIHARAKEIHRVAMELSGWSEPT